MSMLSPLVQCVGFAASQLTADQRSKVQAVIDAVTPATDLIAVRLYPNLDTTSEEDLPSGMQLVLRSNAKVDPTLISDNMFQVLAVSRVYPDTAQGQDKDAYYDQPKRLAALQGAVGQFGLPQGEGHELGGTGSFVGVYSKLRDNNRDKDHYIVARGTVPLQVQELKKRITASSDAGPTYRDLFYKDEWRALVHGAENDARRNVFRTIANAAEAMEVNVDRIDDLATTTPSGVVAPAEMAVPDWEQATFSMDVSAAGATTLSYGVVPSQDCLQLKDGQFFVVGSPYDGISLFPLSQHDRIIDAMGVPVDTGRRMAADKVPRTAAAAATMQSIAGTWDGKTLEADFHPDLHPEAWKSASTPEFRSGMQHMGWNPVDHVSVLVPLAVKIYNPDLKRMTTTKK